jgi:DNA-binding MarR family transcriptional regulator
LTVSIPKIIVAANNEFVTIMPKRKKDQLSQDAEDLYEALNQLVRVYQFRDRDRICCYDVSVTQCYAVETLVKKGAMRLQVLAEEMFLDKSTASRVIDALERKGYVSRAEDNEDRRAVKIQATDAGRELYEKIRGDLIAEEITMIENLSAEARQGALTLLRQITRATEKRCGLTNERGSDPTQAY